MNFSTRHCTPNLVPYTDQAIGGGDEVTRPTRVEEGRIPKCLRELRLDARIGDLPSLLV